MTRPTFAETMAAVQAEADRIKLPWYMVRNLAIGAYIAENGWDENDGIGSSDGNYMIVSQWEHGNLRSEMHLAALLPNVLGF